MEKILIVEDEAPISELMVFNLEKVGFSVTSAPDANFALQAMEDMEYHLVLLDLMLPGLQGIDFLKIIRNKNKFRNIPVMIISAKNTEEDIVK
jgi:two-component system phosphate regulon response regulator PhoB